MMLNGIRIFSHPLAEQTIVTFTIEKLAINKRRRGYRVKRNTDVRPCAIRTPDGIFLHPSLYEKLKAAGLELMPWKL